MSKMIRANLCEKISDDTAIPKIDVYVALECFFLETILAVERGESIEIRGFGTFIAKKRKPKVARNMRTGARVIIPERFLPFFRPSPVFAKRLKNLKELVDNSNPNYKRKK